MSTSTTATPTGTTRATTITCAPCAPVSIKVFRAFALLHAAWRRARRGKKPSPNQLSFDAHWIDGLLELERQLMAGTWRPRRTTCFIATAPKAREIHAPDFADRVVHHWLVPKLEAIYEPIFIFDSFSNRRGKGTHAAVDRLQGFMREVESGQGGGWYLQLDIKNFFNRIHRPTLYALLKERMERHDLPIECRRAVHALPAPIAAGAGRHLCLHARGARTCAAAQAAGPGAAGVRDPDRQSLEPVLRERLPRSARPVRQANSAHRGTFVMLTTLFWSIRAAISSRPGRPAIASFSRSSRSALRLELKADTIKLRPLTAGCRLPGLRHATPTHTVVRRRVIGHCRAKLHDWQRRHVHGSRILPVWRSYEGHFSHANSLRLLSRFHREFPWLRNIS